MKTYKLILLRHGESKWNLENRFTGWTDVDLTENGEKEAKRAGVLILDNKLKIDIVYVSYLKRAIRTSKICLKQLKIRNLALNMDWRLNERHYGNLQGLNKTETSKKYGEDQVRIWRRSYDTPPPEMNQNDKRHPKYDPLYKNVDPKSLPNSESLKDTLNRVKPLWLRKIFPQIKDGKSIMIVAHGNSLRAIVKMLKNMSNNDIIKLNIPTGMPYIFEFSNEFDILNDYYLGDEDEISKKTNLIANQASWTA
tara:strand:- start:2066 stop:2821 length:756 start_codon:yes stop_codon:yes gene_type:complete